MAGFTDMERIEAFCQNWKARTYGEFLKKAQEKAPTLHQYAMNDPNGEKKKEIKKICRAVNKACTDDRGPDEPQKTMIDRIRDYCQENEIRDFDEFVKNATQDAYQLVAYARRHRTAFDRMLRHLAATDKEDWAGFWQDLGVPVDGDGEPIGI